MDITTRKAALGLSTIMSLAVSLGPRRGFTEEYATEREDRSTRIM